MKRGDEDGGLPKGDGWKYRRLAFTGELGLFGPQLSALSDADRAIYLDLDFLARRSPDGSSLRLTLPRPTDEELHSIRRDLLARGRNRNLRSYRRAVGRFAEVGLLIPESSAEVSGNYRDTLGKVTLALLRKELENHVFYSELGKRGKQKQDKGKDDTSLGDDDTPPPGRAARTQVERNSPSPPGHGNFQDFQEGSPTHPSWKSSGVPTHCTDPAGAPSAELGVGRLADGAGCSADSGPDPHPIPHSDSAAHFEDGDPRASMTVEEREQDALESRRLFEIAWEKLGAAPRRELAERAKLETSPRGALDGGVKVKLVEYFAAGPDADLFRVGLHVLRRRCGGKGGEWYERVAADLAAGNHQNLSPIERFDLAVAAADEALRAAKEA